MRTTMPLTSAFGSSRGATESALDSTSSQLAPGRLRLRHDSGACARTAGVNYFGGWSFSSASYSNDSGRTFVDIGYMNPGNTFLNFIAGDPVVACTSPTQFYYSSIFAFGQDSSGNFFNGVAVNSSSDGGQTWSDPAAAVAKDLRIRLISRDSQLSSRSALTKLTSTSASTATVSPFRCASRTRLWKGGRNERIDSPTSTVAHDARGTYRGLVLKLGPNYDPESNYARTQSAELGHKSK